MKFILISALTVLLLVSCGSKNTSGQPAIPEKVYDPIQVETTLRDEFYDQGKEVLRTYHREIRAVLGDKIFIRMNRELRKSNISFSREVLTDDLNRAVRSYRTVEGITVLYIGENESELNWSNHLYVRDLNLHRLVMHELIEMAGVSDHNLRYTNRILGR